MRKGNDDMVCLFACSLGLEIYSLGLSYIFLSPFDISHTPNKQL